MLEPDVALQLLPGADEGVQEAAPPPVQLAMEAGTAHAVAVAAVDVMAADQGGSLAVKRPREAHRTDEAQERPAKRMAVRQTFAVPLPGSGGL